MYKVYNKPQGPNQVPVATPRSVSTKSNEQFKIQQLKYKNCVLYKNTMKCYVMCICLCMCVQCMLIAYYVWYKQY